MTQTPLGLLLVQLVLSSCLHAEPAADPADLVKAIESARAQESSTPCLALPRASRGGCLWDLAEKPRSVRTCEQMNINSVREINPDAVEYCFTHFSESAKAEFCAKYWASGNVQALAIKHCIGPQEVNRSLGPKKRTAIMYLVSGELLFYGYDKLFAFPIDWLLKDVDGNTALHLAKENWRSRIIQADPRTLDALNKDGQDPFMFYARNGDLWAGLFGNVSLNGRSYDRNRKDARGNTFLHLIAQVPRSRWWPTDSEMAISALHSWITAGGSLAAENHARLTPAKIASANHQSEYFDLKWLAAHLKK